MQCGLVNMHHNQWKLLHLSRTAEVVHKCNKNEPLQIMSTQICLSGSFDKYLPVQPRVHEFSSLIQHFLCVPPENDCYQQVQQSRRRAWEQNRIVVPMTQMQLSTQTNAVMLYCIIFH